MKIIWSPKAILDLNRIVDFISRDKKEAALQWARLIHHKVSRLQRLPKSGRVVPEAGRLDIREILIGDYRVVYKIGSQISVLTVFHGSKEDLADVHDFRTATKEAAGFHTWKSVKKSLARKS